MVRLQKDMVDDDLEMNENGGVASKHMKSLEDLFRKFEDYCKELAGFGFNSAGYDIKLIKKISVLRIFANMENNPISPSKRLESIHASSLNA